MIGGELGESPNARHTFFKGMPVQKRFGRFAFDPSRRQLLRDGRPVHLSPKAFLLLGLLLERAPAALAKDDIVRSIWPDASVGDASLTNIVTELRAALGDSAREPRFIRTVHGFGYAFCVESETGVQLSKWRVRHAGRIHALKEGDNLIGRDAAATVAVDDTAVSRRHASLSVAGTTVTIKDLGSRNGTFVNGSVIEKATGLRDGDLISLGPVSLILERISDGSTRTHPRPPRST